MIGALAVGRIRVAQSTGGREAVPPVAAFMDRCAVVKITAAIAKKVSGKVPSKAKPKAFERRRARYVLAP